MTECRFMIRIANSSDKLFHCAANVNGWAFMFSENDDACLHCSKKVNGKPTVVDHELKSAEFWELSGTLIREQDWKLWEDKG